MLELGQEQQENTSADYGIQKSNKISLTGICSLTLTGDRTNYTIMSDDFEPDKLKLIEELMSGTLEEEIVHYLKQKQHIQREISQNELHALRMIKAVATNPAFPYHK